MDEAPNIGLGLSEAYTCKLAVVQFSCSPFVVLFLRMMDILRPYRDPEGYA